MTKLVAGCGWRGYNPQDEEAQPAWEGVLFLTHLFRIGTNPAHRKPVCSKKNWIMWGEV